MPISSGSNTFLVTEDDLYALHDLSEFLGSRHTKNKDESSEEKAKESLKKGIKIAGRIDQHRDYPRVKNFLREIRYAAVLVVVGLTIYFIRARMRVEWPFDKTEEAIA